MPLIIIEEKANDSFCPLRIDLRLSVHTPCSPETCVLLEALPDTTWPSVTTIDEFLDNFPTVNYDFPCSPFLTFSNQTLKSSDRQDDCWMKVSQESIQRRLSPFADFSTKDQMGWRHQRMVSSFFDLMAGQMISRSWSLQTTRISVTNKTWRKYSLPCHSSNEPDSLLSC